jgi:hypothetical protein
MVDLLPENLDLSFLVVVSSLLSKH